MSPNWRIVIGDETYEFDVYDLFGTYEFYRAVITVRGREFSDQGRSDEGRECVQRIAGELLSCQYDVREIIPPNTSSAFERGARAQQDAVAHHIKTNLREQLQPRRRELNGIANLPLVTDGDPK